MESASRLIKLNRLMSEIYGDLQVTECKDYLLAPGKDITIRGIIYSVITRSKCVISPFLPEYSLLLGQQLSHQNPLQHAQLLLQFHL